MEKLLQIFRVREIRSKILYVLAILVIFRVAANIPIPGIDPLRLKSFFESNQFLGLLNLFSGGALSHLSLIMLGLSPYITAVIVMQLLTMIFPKLEQLYKEEGERGRQKFNQYGRLLTVPFAILQGYGMLILFRNQGVVNISSFFDTVLVLATITAGTVFLMWLGELISEKGIGNGVSLLIFAGIVAGFPTHLRQTLATYDASQIPSYIGFLVIALLVIVGVIIITEGRRNIPISYAKRVRGNKVYGGVSTYLPLNVNPAGVIPIIFAISFLMFPSMIGGFLQHANTPWLASAAGFLVGLFNKQGITYIAVYFVLVVLFTYLYTAVTFDPKNVSENLQRMGGFVPGIRPGKPTSDFLFFILNRVLLIGALFLGLVAVIPTIVQNLTGITSFAVGGTSVLIVVSVVLETMRQLESQLTMRDYDGF